MSTQDDFDFLFAGPWRVASHRRGRDGDRWERFEGRSDVQRLMGGLGHLELLSIPALPDGTPVEAFTVRLFEPATGLWRIWWSASTRPGHLDAPMVGRFADGVGTFHGDDLPGDVPVRLRFRWLPDAPAGPRWEQARSRDGGGTWRTDWTMDLSPAPAG